MFFKYLGVKKAEQEAMIKIRMDAIIVPEIGGLETAMREKHVAQFMKKAEESFKQEAKDIDASRMLMGVEFKKGEVVEIDEMVVSSKLIDKLNTFVELGLFEVVKEKK
jgi:hypothetical protein